MWGHMRKALHVCNESKPRTKQKSHMFGLCCCKHQHQSAKQCICGVLSNNSCGESGSAHAHVVVPVGIDTGKAQDKCEFQTRAGQEVSRSKHETPRKNSKRTAQAVGRASTWAMTSGTRSRTLAAAASGRSPRTGKTRIRLMAHWSSEMDTTTSLKMREMARAAFQLCGAPSTPHWLT